MPGPYAAAQRERLTELRLGTEERRAALLLELGRTDEAVADLRELADREPGRESVRDLLTTALHHGGRRAEALRVQARPEAPIFAAELAVLRSAVAAGCGGSYWISGEPGAGKTGLIGAALDDAPRAGWATGDELARQRPLSVLLDCLREAAPDDATRAAVAKLTAAEDPRPHDVVKLVHRLAAEAPLTLVVDDMQWADQATRDTWRELHRLTMALPLLLVATARPDPGADRLRKALTGADVLELAPLTTAEATVLARQLAPGLPPADVDGIVRDAAGNPYYLRHLAAARDAGQELSPALIAAVGGHLGRFAEPVRNVLRAVAFFDAPCTADDLSTVVGEPRPEVEAAIEVALSAGLLTINPHKSGKEEGGERLAFRHPVVGRVLHDATPTALRVMLHRAFAEQLAAAGRAPELVAAQLLTGSVPIDAWAASWIAAHLAPLSTRVPHVALRLLRAATARPAADREIRLTLTAGLARLSYWLGEPAGDEAGWVLSRTGDAAVAAEMRWIVALSRADPEAGLADVRDGIADPGTPEPWRDRYRLLHERLGRYGKMSEPVRQVSVIR